MRTPTVLLASCVLSLVACGSDGPSGPSPAVGDVGIAFIQRLPEVDYVLSSRDPAREGWPLPGSEVVWRAHIRNGTDARRESVRYRWLLDGAEIAGAVVDIPAAGEATIDLARPWSFERHLLVFEIDSRETGRSTLNDRLEIFTDALSVGFYVERSVYEHFARHQVDLGVGSTSFEDWAQRQIRAYNEMFEAAIYPEAAAGVLDRLRLDRITVVEDGALPLVPVARAGFQAAQAVPNLGDRTVDIQWGFPASVLPAYQDTRTVISSNQFYYSGFLQHEMGHARYLVDVYGLDVYQGTSGDSISILEGGLPVVGSRFMPGVQTTFNGDPGTRVYQAQQGLMHDDWTYLDRHSAGALNRIAGHRATRGNFNAPENLGEYLNDLPAENRLTVQHAAGQPLPGALVSLYRSEQDAVLHSLDSIYRKHYDAEADLELIADAEGRVLLGRDPFSGGTGVILRDDFTNATLIVRVEHEGRVGYGFLDVTSFNQAYWRGETDLADHLLRVELHER